MGRAETVLSLECVCLNYGNKAVVEELSLTLSRGEVVGLLGSNGSGKSTTLAACAGLLRPVRGTIRLAGLCPQRQPLDYRRLLGFVPQELAVYEELSGRDNLLFFGRMYGLTGRELARRVNESLNFVRLIDRANDRVGTYSGGMQRRLNLACALLHRPALLLLDEPTVGLDIQSREAIQDCLTLLREQGTAILVTTHHLDEAETLCDRLMILRRGQLVAQGSLVELLAGLDPDGVLPLRVAYDADAPEAVRQVMREKLGQAIVRVDQPQQTPAPSRLERVLRHFGKERAKLMTLGLIWELARKDLRLFLADWRGALLCFAIPILLATAFAAVFQRQAGGDVFQLRASLVVEDDHPLTANIVTALCGKENIQVRRQSLAESRRELESATSGVVFIIPTGFGASLERLEGRPGPLPAVTILHRPGQQLEARLAEGLLSEVALREAARVLLAPLAQVGVSAQFERPFDVRAEPLTGPREASLNVFAHAFCGMSLQYLLFWGMDSGLLLLRERNRGIWRRLRTAPLGLGTLLAGKALATALIALAQMGVTFLFAWVVFGVTIGSLAGFVLMAGAAACLSAATGLVVAALGGNENRARSVAILTILTVSMLGGLWLPMFLLPAWVQDLALILPTTWAARGLEGVTWQGMDWLSAGRCATMVLAYALAFLLVAVWCFRQAEARVSREGNAG